MPCENIKLQNKSASDSPTCFIQDENPMVLQSPAGLGAIGFLRFAKKLIMSSCIIENLIRNTRSFFQPEYQLLPNILIYLDSDKKFFLNRRVFISPFPGLCPRFPFLASLGKRGFLLEANK
jgi:hypothetical protein